MRLAATTLLALLMLSGCQSHDVRRPLDAEALGLHPKMNPTADEALKLQQDTIAAFEATLGKPLPTQFRLDGPATGWFTDVDELRQLRASAWLPRTEFRTRTAFKGWHEIDIPREYLSAMHLPRNVPRIYMTCYIRVVNNQPAYLFWSDIAQTVMLVLDY